MTQPEYKIQSILNAANVPHLREKTFQDLPRGPYRYDFYIPSINTLIEYDGEQHFKYIPKFYKNKSEFTKAKERDRIKNSYALSHSIKLYRIPYWELSNVNTYNDLFQDKFLVKSKFHNDTIYQSIK